jgi:hypothetical protein
MTTRNGDAAGLAGRTAATVWLRSDLTRACVMLSFRLNSTWLNSTLILPDRFAMGDRQPAHNYVRFD